MYSMLCSLQGDVQTTYFSPRGKQPKRPKTRTEQHFQDVAQKLQKNKNSDTFAAHFAQNVDQKLTPHQCRGITRFKILSTVNPISSMKTWIKYLCTLCMKNGPEIISRSQHRYVKLINACSEVYVAFRHKPKFHRFTRH